MTNSQATEFTAGWNTQQDNLQSHDTNISETNRKLYNKNAVILRPYANRILARRQYANVSSQTSSGISYETRANMVINLSEQETRLPTTATAIGMLTCMSSVGGRVFQELHGFPPVCH